MAKTSLIRTGGAKPLKSSKSSHTSLTIEQVLAQLNDIELPLTAAVINRLSDLNTSDLARFREGWPNIPVERRSQLLQRLGETSETNFELDFVEVTRLGLGDADEEVRVAAIEAAWYDETRDFLYAIMKLAVRDPAEAVRAEALSAMGRFILLGELDELKPSLAREAQDVALAVYRSDDESIDVRRRAVEALGNCTREGVPDLIRDAYESDDSRMRASALFAMGRSCDDVWAGIILDELVSDDPEMRYEAARAAGELELSDAVERLGQLLHDDDREVLEMAVSALGEIGGDEARELLEAAIERAEIAGDEGLIEAIHESLEHASLIGEDLTFDD
jgi:HEAT repeat protein